MFASEEPCLRIQQEETTKVPNRTFTAIAPSDLASLKLPISWVMGILVCSDETIRAIEDWLRQVKPKDHDRVVVFLHRGISLKEVLRRLRACGFGEVTTFEVEDFTSLHHEFGNAHGVQVVRDHMSGLI